jgi:ssDNA-binding Zn-finger/Zn-ribbon topoisomerase 1
MICADTTEFENAGKAPGRCPDCGALGVLVKVSREHWFVCHEHQVKWYMGYDVTPDEQPGTPDEQAQNQAILDYYWEVVPTYEDEEP